MNNPVIINNEEFIVNSSEFVKNHHGEFNNLFILDSLGLLERIISLLNEVTLMYENKPNLLLYNSTHGGYVPIKCANKYKNIYISGSDSAQNENLIKNMYKHNIQNISLVDNNIITDSSETIYDVVYNNGKDKMDINLNISILLCHKIHAEDIHLKGCYTLKNTDLILYIPSSLIPSFIREFHYFIEDETVLNYDNLIHYTMIVKNGGDELENVLNKNLNIIDRWTILDTGSTDNTINIINKVLVGKKKGQLYQEPFVDFKFSRNRCLDLAGKTCKFIIMLDDTYIIEGDLRKMLNTCRGDQFSDSFSLFIKSDDVFYASNRIIKSETNLRYIYRIHEVITPKNNKNVIIPFIHSTIFDFRCDYMQDRTMNRKKYDLDILYKELEDDPDDPRALYYLGQTYNLLENHEKAFEFFLRRIDHPVEGFLQEKIDACFEAARLANFKLGKPWEYCNQLYMRSFDMDTTRGDALYFIGIHYYLDAIGGIDPNNNFTIAYEHFKKCFNIGYPEHCQYSLKPTLHFYFLPKFLVHVAYINKDFEVGLKACSVFLKHVKEDNSVLIFQECFNHIEFKTMKDWNSIYGCLNLIPKTIKQPIKNSEIPILVFMADGGFSSWTGKDILTTGMGGSETFVIELSKHIQRSGYFKVIVFCRCEQNELYEGVEYRRLSEYFSFIFENNIHTCIIGRYSEYLPVTIESTAKNIYMVAHDMDFTGNIIHLHSKLKNIFCLSNWHAEFYSNMMPMVKDITRIFGHGIDSDLFDLRLKRISTNFPVFIYSSFPIRGLLPLLEMWPKIIQRYPTAILNIHSDINGVWSNTMRPVEMNKIKNLLQTYADDKSIVYHGWTSKKDLAKSWSKADVCFYPCTYLETFCHTMLEAAISKTLIVTSDLGALPDTVGNRGILLKGDFYDPSFQNEALDELFKIIDNQSMWSDLVEKNYTHVQNLSWYNKADELLKKYLLPTVENPIRYIQNNETPNNSNFKNINTKLNYAGMYNWTNDLPEGSIIHFTDTLEYILWKNQGKIINILEIGTYSGTSLIKFLELLPNSRAVVIDKWENYIENTPEKNKVSILESISDNDIEKIFYQNIKNTSMEDRIVVMKGDSNEKLTEMISTYTSYFDFIYVDGSHRLLDLYCDLVLSFSLLKIGGVIGIDDYLYNKDTILESPYEGVNHFIEKFKNNIKILSKGYRVFIEKM